MENPAHQQTTLCDILINIRVLQVYVQCTDHLLLKIWVTLTLTFQFESHSRSNVTVPLNSPYMVSYSCFIVNIGPKKTAISDLVFDLSRSLKVKCDCAIWTPDIWFLFMFNSNIGPNLASLWDIRLWNLSDFEYDLGAVGFSIYKFLFMLNTVSRRAKS